MMRAGAMAAEAAQPAGGTDLTAVGLNSARRSRDAL